MKSLTYLFTGNPKYFYDCLDYACRKNFVEVSLELETTEIITAMAIGKQLVAMFDFKFSDRTVSCERILGGCLAQESENKQLKTLQKANGRLERYLEEIRSVCLEIRGADKRFDDSLIYKHCAISSDNLLGEKGRNQRIQSSAISVKPIGNRNVVSV